MRWNIVLRFHEGRRSSCLSGGVPGINAYDGMIFVRIPKDILRTGKSVSRGIS